MSADILMLELPLWLLISMNVSCLGLMILINSDGGTQLKVLYSFFLLFFCSRIEATPHLLALGDSLTEGYGVNRQAAWPALLESHLRKRGYPKASVRNGGSSGATTASCLRSAKFQLKYRKPDIAILAYGGNDGLRGLPIEPMKKRLSDCVSYFKIKGVKVVLAGMLAAPNYGPKFVKEFSAAFRDLSVNLKVPVVPFLLEGVAGQPELNLPDGIHPNEAGYRKVAEVVWREIEPLLIGEAK